MREYTVAALNRLVEAFERLPGIGHKSAQRLAFHMLSLTQEEVKNFADSIVSSWGKIRQCKVCQNLTEDELCPICCDDKRDKSVICVVEDPRDVAAIERTHEFDGLYHVLHGTMSPMDNIGPDEIKIKELIARLGDDTVKEVIMATNPTVEGETTAMYISRLIKPMGIKVSRLAYGVPVGASLEYADEYTLRRAIEGRSEI